MADNSAIEWTDAAWNPVLGCTSVSDGCTNCYAARLAHRLGEVFGQEPYRGLTRPVGNTRRQNWTGEVRCLPERLDWPLRWRKPRRIFVTSMSDLFHEAVPDEFIAKVFSVMFRARQHTYQVLTKRPQRMLDFMLLHWSRIGGGLEQHCPHIWLGVSVENQAAAEERIPLLLQTPAAVRFVSAEPLLGPLDLSLSQVVCLLCRWAGAEAARYPAGLGCPACGGAVERQRVIDWVICGGESGGPPERCLVERCDHWIPEFGYGTSQAGCTVTGTHPRPSAGCERTGWRPKPEALEWVRSIRDQVTSAGAVFFFKQWPMPPSRPGGPALLDDRERREFPTQREDR